MRDKIRIGDRSKIKTKQDKIQEIGEYTTYLQHTFIVIELKKVKQNETCTDQDARMQIDVALHKDVHDYQK